MPAYRISKKVGTSVKPTVRTFSDNDEALREAKAMYSDELVSVVNVETRELVYVDERYERGWRQNTHFVTLNYKVGRWEMLAKKRKRHIIVREYESGVLKAVES